MPTTASPRTSPDALGDRLTQHQRIVVLTDGFSTPFLAKTAISLLRYRADRIAAVLDATAAGATAQELLSAGGEIPVVARLEDVPQADAIYIGIAPPGGGLPEAWRPVLAQAIERGLDIVSGLHDFIEEDDEFRALATASGARLLDVRRNRFRQVATAQPFRHESIRVLTVGHDCSVGKMVASLEVERALKQRQQNALFMATGQTGIMVSGRGIPVDCVVSDFVNGTVEQFLRDHQQYDYQLIEGQGSISHPAFSAVTMGLLHGSAPHGLIYCYEAGRTEVKGLPGIHLLPHRTMLQAYETVANLRHPCKIIGVAVNTRALSESDAAAELEWARGEFGLPVCDVYRTGAEPLADAVVRLRQEVLAR